MMDGLDDGPDLLADDASTPASNNKSLRGETVDLTTQSSDLMVDISDALSERDKVKFTVHTKVRATANHSIAFITKLIIMDRVNV